MNMSEELIREIIMKVLETAAQEQKRPDCGFEKIVDPSGVIGIRTSTVKCEPSGQEGVTQKDVVTPEEAPRMGCGIMELDHTSFERTLTCDEYDVIFEGELKIGSDGRVISGGPGDIIYIPGGSHIHFQTPDKTRYAYFRYSAT